ncbi:hypothetical protein [Photobacterium leiognathi]|uniref:hypothetical protein n=1 Tax=Photobacterium leiognathi TaxID=553611 RepID=UPI00298134A5|nr:hypothetical protein [Photobacterium leiognathi]
MKLLSKINSGLLALSALVLSSPVMATGTNGLTSTGTAINTGFSALGKGLIAVCLVAGITCFILAVITFVKNADDKRTYPLKNAGLFLIGGIIGLGISLSNDWMLGTLGITGTEATESRLNTMYGS